MGLNEKFFKSAAVDDTPSFAPVLYTGNWNGSNTNTIEVGFRPDWIWIKRRDGADGHHLYDSVRGMGKPLYSNTTGAENASNHVNTTSTGFTLVTDNVNQNGNLFIAWCWKAGGAASQNNDGTIQGANCLVSANQDAGFSITKYTGNGTSGATFGHGLGQQVGLSIVKNVGSSTYWYVYSNLLPANNNLYLNTADSKQADGVMLGGNSTTVSISASSSVNTNSGSYIAYNFASVNNYQKVGSYTGSSSEHSVNIGFAPRFIMIKRTDSSGSWRMYDSARDGTSVPRRVNHNLQANEASIEYDSTSDSNGYFHITSTGLLFYTVNTNTDVNANNGNYIYLAIA